MMPFSRQCSYIKGDPKKLLTECCWSHGAQAQSSVLGKLFFGRFLQRKFGPTALYFGKDFFVIVTNFGTSCIVSQSTFICAHLMDPMEEVNNDHRDRKFPCDVTFSHLDTFDGYTLASSIMIKESITFNSASL